MSIQDVSTSHLLRIGDLAKLTGKTVRAIHLYEEQGLLHPATRSSGGFRLYEEHAVERVRWIDLLHGLGFSLHEMRELLTSWWKAGLGPDAMDQLRALFQRKLAETREAIVRHQQLENELDVPRVRDAREREGLRALHPGSWNGPRAGAGGRDRHRERERAPNNAAGLRPRRRNRIGSIGSFTAAAIHRRKGASS